MSLPIPYQGSQPTYAHTHDAGADLRLSESVALDAGTIHKVPLDTRVCIPAGYVGILALRSSLGARGLILPNGVGIIDAGYTGPLTLTLIALSDTCLSAGERVAQLVILPVAHADFRPDAPMPDTARGSGGFGSTGTR